MLEIFLLETLSAGDVVIMDNLSSHKSQRVLELIANVRARVDFLPAYSPDLNPIELMWSKVKSILRKIEARNPEDLVKAIGTALNKVTHSGAIGWFNHCHGRFILMNCNYSRSSSSSKESLSPISTKCCQSLTACSVCEEASTSSTWLKPIAKLSAFIFV